MIKIIISCITIALLSSCSVAGSCCKTGNCHKEEKSAESCECKECKDGRECTCDKHEHSKEEKKSCH